MTTRRTLEDGRLFPTQQIGNGWSFSAQADKAGYGCSPRERLDTLEAYETVEVVLYGPEEWRVDPEALDLPEDIRAKFEPVSDCGPAIGLRITHEELAVIRQTLLMAPMHPNAGIPRGSNLWAYRDVWHGGEAIAVRDILENGIDMARSTGGYFGYAFYVADDLDLAASNYADFADADEEPGAVVRLVITDASGILDLRNEKDSQVWAASGLDALKGRPNFASHARAAGVTGVYDRSVGGLAIYDPKILDAVAIEPARDRTTETRPAPRSAAPTP